MRRLIVAIGFLTRLPVPQVALREGDFAAAIRLYPAVGLAIGVTVWLATAAGARIDPWLGAVAGLIAWVGVTGALHLDGLADLADGLGAAHGDRARLLAVMADPHVGSFGVVAIVLQLATKLVLLHLLIGAPALIAIPAVARMGPLLWARWIAPLKPDGLGASVAGAVRPRDLIGWGLVLAGACAFLPALIAAPFVLLALGGWFRRKIGGMTGDVHGAGIELAETGLCVAFVLV